MQKTKFKIPRMIIYILYVFVAIILLFSAFGIVSTIQAHYNPNWQRFAHGTTPSPLPDGFHKGSVSGNAGSWQGKKFDAANMSGLNIFKENGVLVEKYPFKTYISQGVQDKNLQTMKIDYNLPGNALWLRLLLDEIVQVAPHHYLGKVQVRFIPGLPFTFGYFELQK